MIVRVLDHADEVFPVELAGLRRDIGCREAQPQVAGIARVGFFGQHRAIAFSIELVSLDPAEPGDALDFLDGQSAEVEQLAGFLQLSHEGAHQRVERVVGVTRVAGLLEFHDQLAIAAVRHQREKPLAGAFEAHITHVKRVLIILRQCSQAGFDPVGIDQRRKWLAQQRPSIPAQPVLNVFADLLHP